MSDGYGDWISFRKIFWFSFSQQQKIVVYFSSATFFAFPLRSPFTVNATELHAAKWSTGQLSHHRVIRRKSLRPTGDHDKVVLTKTGPATTYRLIRANLITRKREAPPQQITGANNRKQNKNTEEKNRSLGRAHRTNERGKERVPLSWNFLKTIHV